jgi:hypothetical protein
MRRDEEWIKLRLDLRNGCDVAKVQTRQDTIFRYMHPYVPTLAASC